MIKVNDDWVIGVDPRNYMVARNIRETDAEFRKLIEEVTK